MSTVPGSATVPSSRPPRHRRDTGRLSTWVAAGLAAVLATFGIVATAVPSVADTGMTGEISGEIALEGAGWASLDEVQVVAWRLDDSGPEPTATNEGAVTTDEDGTFSFGTDGLTAGDYAFEYNYRDVPPVYAGGFGSGVWSLDEALADTGTHFAPIADDEPLFLHYDMQFGGGVTGTVTSDSTSANLAGQPVRLWRQLEGTATWVEWDDPLRTTDSLGHYTYSGLPAGEYTLRAGGAANYIPEFWDGVLDPQPDDSTSFSVVRGAVNAVDVSLAPGGRISGTVKSTTNGVLNNIDVTAYVFDDAIFDYVEFTSTSTSVKGTYLLGGLPLDRDYRVGFRSPDGATVTYLDRYWNNVDNIEAALDVSIPPTTTIRTGINASMPKAASISGTISLQGGTAIDDGDITIYACSPFTMCDEFSSPGEVTLKPDTDADGDRDYTIAGLPAGQFVVQYMYNGSGNFRSEYFDNKRTQDSATPITLTTGAAVIGKNVQLDLGGTISGHVEDPSGPAVGVIVSAYVPSYEFYPEYAAGTAVTDSNGDYTIVGLDTGKFVVRAEPDEPTGLARQYWDHGYSNNATQLSVTAPIGITGIDFDLIEGVSLSGTITGNDTLAGLPDMGVYLHRFQQSGGSKTDLLAQVTTDGSGFYEFTNLPPGDYAIETGEYGSAYLDAVFGAPSGDIDPADGTRITITTADVSQDVGMDRGGEYTGRIVDQNGAPIAGVRLQSDSAESVESGSDGRFSIAPLREGTHPIYIEAAYAGDYVTNLIVPGPPTTFNALPVDLGDITVADGSSISGVVLGTNGKPVPNTFVSVYLAEADGGAGYRTSEMTDASGRFTVGGLPPQQVYLYFEAPAASGYGPQFLGGGPEWALSDAIDLPAGGSSRFVEVRLMSGGTISGVVKNKTTGRVIPGLGVSAEQSVVIHGDTQVYEYYQETFSNSKGAYALPGLPQGSYQVTFGSRTTGVSASYAPEVRTVWVPDKVKVMGNASLVPLTRVTGVVRDDAAQPLEDIEVHAVPVGGSADDGVVVGTDRVGAYTLLLKPGAWNISFVDPEHRSAVVYLGTSPTPSAKPQITVASVPLTGRNVVMHTDGGAIDIAAITGSVETDPSGTITVERLVSGAVVSTETLGAGLIVDPASIPLSDYFPIEHLVPGTYRLTFDAWSSVGPDDGQYLAKVVDDIPVTAGETTVVPDVSLGVPIANSYLFLDAVPGAGPVISGTTQVGESLLTTTGSWYGTPSIYYYQWMRNGVPIRGATEQSYTLAPGDANAFIGVRVGASESDQYYPDYDAAAYTAGPITPGAAPQYLVAPATSGNAYAGQTLTLNKGEWDLPGLAFGYRWLRDGSPITGATAVTYRLTTADVGKAITVELTASRSGFDSTTFVASAPPIQPATALKRTKAGMVTLLADGFKVTPGTWTPAPTSYAYEWREYDPGTGAFSVFGDGASAHDVDVRAATTRVTVVITAARAGYTSTKIEVPVRSGPAPVFTTPPALPTTTPQVGFPFAVDTSAVVTDPVGAAATYQWYRGSTLIRGATSATYIPVKADLNATLKVRVKLTAPGYAAQTTAQQPLLASLPVAPAGVFAVDTEPTITGNPWVGRTVTADPGTRVPAAASYTYKWTRNGVAIAKATGKSYVLTATDLGKEIGVVVTAIRDGYAPLPSPSSPVVATAVAVQNKTAPTLPAVARVGTALAAGVGTWDLAPTSYTYQWYVNDEPVTGAALATFTPTTTELGDDISVAVVARRTGFPDSAATRSNAVTVDPGLALKASTPPLLTVAGKTVKSLKLGQSLATSSGVWPIAALDLTYQWQVYRDGTTGWENLDGQTGKLLVLSGDPGDFDIGFMYRVVVVASRAGYLPGPAATSSALTIVG